jgi:O-antigen ligase
MALLFGLWASFCRAAWLSAVVVLVLLPAVLLPARWRSIAGMGTVLTMVAVLLLLWRSTAGRTVHGNSDDAGVRESLLSITNTTTDASNRERLNRWRCALRMFKADPWLGTGPGTYQFLYVAHQRPEEMTYLSVREPGAASRIKRSWSLTPDTFIRSNPQTLYDSGGTAHSEYLLALAESGLTGFGAWCALLGCVLWRALRNWWGPKPFQARIIDLTVGVAIAAYAVHALFNNYLDDAKVAFPFWMMIAALHGRGPLAPADHSRSNARQS